jgi:hypothetical protein
VTRRSGLSRIGRSRIGLSRSGVSRSAVTSIGRSRFGLIGVVVLVLAVVYVVAWGTRTGATQASPVPGSQTAAVTNVTRICPPPGPGSGQAHVALVSVPPRQAKATTSGTSGVATLRAIPNTSTAENASTKNTSVTTPNVPVVLPAPQAAQFDGTEIDATGQLAEGFEAEQATANGTGIVTCAHPGSNMWFVGTGQGAGASVIWLYLMNSGASAASVDVTILTDAGVQSGNDSVITVAPHQYTTVNIAQLAKGSTTLAVRVQTMSGQVAADVWEDGGSGGAWLPLAASPATRLVIPGMTAASGTAKLFVAVPGATDAQLKVTALTAQGKFLPFGTAAVDAPSGAASTFALSSLGASGSSLVLTSNVPVTADVLIPGNGIGGFATAASPVTDQGVVAGNPAGGGATVGLVLSAPGAGARVAITTISPERTSAPAQPRILTVTQGHTLTVPVSPPKGGGSFAIVVTPEPGSGPLYAARVVTSGGSGLSGQLQSDIPVTSALTQIQLPPATDSYQAILPLRPRHLRLSVPKCAIGHAVSVMAMGLSVEAGVAVAGVDRFRVDAEDEGELLDDHVENQVAELVVVLGPGKQGPTVHDDAGGGGRPYRVARVGGAGHHPRERERVAVVGQFIGVGYFLDRELHSRQLVAPARLEAGHGVEHHVVELLGPGAVQRHARGHQAAAQATSAAVPPPDAPDRTGAGVQARIGTVSGTVLTAAHSY